MHILPLSPREEAVALLVVNGQTSKEIGRVLGISFRTVEVHRTHLLQKFKAKNSAEFVRMFLLQPTSH